MDKLIDLNGKDLSVSSVIAARRLKKAQIVFTKGFLINIFSLCFFLLGMKRKDIASLLDIPLSTTCAKVRTFMGGGAPALVDRREKKTSVDIEKETIENEVTVEQATPETVIKVGDISISIPENNTLQARTILLTFVQNNLLSKSDAAKVLNVTPTHIDRLCKDLEDKDIHSLIDSRKGQKKDFKYTPEIKSELIQIVVLNCLTGEKTSGKSVGAELEAKFEVSFSERAVRHHMEKLGLNQIKKSLRERYDSIKKKSSKLPPEQL